jgi:hypothetical protein
MNEPDDVDGRYTPGRCFRHSQGVTATAPPSRGSSLGGISMHKDPGQ